MNYIAMPGLVRDRSIYSTVTSKDACQVLDVITSHFQIPFEELIKKCRKRNIVIARQFAYYFLRKRTLLTLKEIADIFGGQDHTTCIHGITTINDLVKTDAVFSDHKKELNFKLNQYKSL